jgi:hypothetical protein
MGDGICPDCWYDDEARRSEQETDAKTWDRRVLEEAEYFYSGVVNGSLPEPDDPRMRQILIEFADAVLAKMRELDQTRDP